MKLEPIVKIHMLLGSSIAQSNSTSGDGSSTYYHYLNNLGQINNFTC